MTPRIFYILFLLILVSSPLNAQYKSHFDAYIDSLIGSQTPISKTSIQNYTPEERAEKIIFFTLKAIFNKKGFDEIITQNDSVLYMKGKENKMSQYKIGITMKGCIILMVKFETNNVYKVYADMIKKELIGINLSEHLTQHEINGIRIDKIDKELICVDGYITLSIGEEE